MIRRPDMAGTISREMAGAMWWAVGAVAGVAIRCGVSRRDFMKVAGWCFDERRRQLFRQDSRAWLRGGR